MSRRKEDVLHIFELLFWMSSIAWDTRLFSTELFWRAPSKNHCRSHSLGGSQLFPQAVLAKPFHVSKVFRSNSTSPKVIWHHRCEKAYITQSEFTCIGLSFVSSGKVNKTFMHKTNSTGKK